MAPPLLPITRLVSCSSCAEHVKSSETVCPHCGAELRGPEARVGRAAGAVLMGLALSGCPEKEPEPTGGATESGTSGGASSSETGSGETGSESGSESGSGEGTGTTSAPEPEYGVPTSGEQDYGVPATDSLSNTDADPSTGTTDVTDTGGNEPLYGGGAT
jgi:hypothetical protein